MGIIVQVEYKVLGGMLGGVVKQEGVGPIHNEKDQRKRRVRGRSSHPDEGQERGSGRRDGSFGEGGQS